MAEFRIRSTGEVVSQGEIRRRNSNTSFPAVWNQSVFDFLGIDPVFASPQPSNTDPLKFIRQNGVVEDANGNWVENWEVVDLFSGDDKAEKEAEYLAKRIADQWARIRQERNNLLKETDWRFRSDLTPSQEWVDYCQALRDITEQADPFAISWPVQPV